MILFRLHSSAQNVRQEKQALEKKLQNLTNLLFERSPDRKRDSDTILKRNTKRNRTMRNDDEDVDDRDRDRDEDGDTDGDGDAVVNEASTPLSEDKKEIEASGQSRRASCRKSWNGFDQFQVMSEA